MVGIVNLFDAPAKLIERELRVRGLNVAFAALATAAP